MAVTFERTEYGYRISRTFQTLGAAASGAAQLESVCEKAFAPAAPAAPATSAIEFEADPVLQAMIDRADEEAPLEGLTAGKAYMADYGANPVSQKDEE